MRKYEYVTSEDLGYKPVVVERANLEYFSLGKIFNNGLEKHAKKDEILK